MEAIIRRLKTEALELSELESLYHQYEDQAYVLLLISKQQECSPELEEQISSMIYSNSLSGKYSAKEDKIINMVDSHGNPLEFEHLVSLEFQEGLKEEAKALLEMEAEDLIPVKAKRIKGSLFYVETAQEEPIVVPEEAFLFQQKKTGSYFLKKAVMMTVLFSVVSGVGSKAFAGTSDSINKVSIVYELDTDPSSNSIQAKLDKIADSTASDLKFYADHFQFEKESQSFEKLSKILKAPVNSADDLKKLDLHKIKKTLSSEDRMEAELSIIDLEKHYAKKITMKPMVQETVQDLDLKIKALQEGSIEGNLSGEAQGNLEKIKEYKQVIKPLKEIAGENKDQKNFETMKSVYSKFVFNQ